jgi:radical SAM superfamily enzyme YgiQ (UPF0313 family)
MKYKSINEVDDIFMDCLLIHPAMRSKGVTYFPVMPMGMFSMADYLNRLGLKCGILNIASEYMLDPYFTIVKYLKKNRVKVVGIGLHWYVHSFSAIEIARQIKEYDSDIIVVLGGYTATYYDMEIIEKYSCVDAVIRGEGEIALGELAKYPDAEKLYMMPNHTARKSGAATRCDEFLLPGDDVLDSLNYSNIDYLEHNELYIANCSHSSTISYINTKKPIVNLFYISTGRGCGNNCSYCGGGSVNYRRLTGRSKPYIRPAENVLREMEELVHRGVSTFYFEYDPLSSTQNYYLDLFSLIRESCIKVGANYSSWGLPGADFLDAFAATFDMEHSCLCFVPKSGSENIRSMNKSNSYTNRQFVDTIKAACERGIFPSINYKVGQPGENHDDFMETVRLSNELRKLPLIQSVSLLPTDPGSPMFMNPEKYGVKLFRKSFIDFYNAYRDYTAGRLPDHPVGYETEHFTERELVALKIEAYRIFYMRLDYILNRRRKAVGRGRLMKYIKVFLSVLFGIPSILMKEEK